MLSPQKSLIRSESLFVPVHPRGRWPSEIVSSLPPNFVYSQRFDLWVSELTHSPPTSGLRTGLGITTIFLCK